MFGVPCGLSFPCGTPVAGDILIHPGIKFKPVEAYSLCTDGQLCEIGADGCVETVSVHAKVGRGIAKSDDARQWRMGTLIRTHRRHRNYRESLSLVIAQVCAQPKSARLFPAT